MLIATASGNGMPVIIKSGMPNSPDANPTEPCTTLLKNRITLTSKYCEMVSGMELHGRWWTCLRRAARELAKPLQDSPRWLFLHRGQDHARDAFPRRSVPHKVPVSLAPVS